MDMKNQPAIHHKIVEILFINRALTTEQIDEILACDKTTLVKDLQNIIQFCNSELDDIDNDFSYNLLYYALFLLKEIEGENQLDIILEILKWDEEKIDFWFGDLFTEYYWNLVYHFGHSQIDTLVDFLKQEAIDTFSREQVALAFLQIYFKHAEHQKIISYYWTELLEFYNSTPKDSEYLDHTYLAFFTSYVCNPNDIQCMLIKNLYDNHYVDLSVNGDFDELFEIIETEKNVKTVYDINNDFIEFENRRNRSYDSKLFESFKEFNSKPNPIILEKKINRNDPCPCGSGLKYKKCCLN